MTNCICGEINARHCPIHQDTKKAPREFLVPSDWQINGPKVTERGDTLCVAKSDYEELQAQCEKLAAALKYYDHQDAQETLREYERFKNGKT